MPAWRVVGPDAPIGISDDGVAEPEPELVVDATGRIAGYSVCNDVTARSIERANPLYLPHVKTYRASCALGPGIVPASDLDAGDLGISLRVLRDGRRAIEGETRTERDAPAPSRISSPG